MSDITIINFRQECSSSPHSQAATKLDLEHLGNQIMAKQSELVAQLTATGAHIEKIGNETRTLLSKIEDLQTAIGNQSDVSPELQAAADALDAQVTVVDELVTDAPAPSGTPVNA